MRAKRPLLPHPVPPTPGQFRIREVWAENLDEELAYIRVLIQHYTYVAMVRAFSGVLLFFSVFGVLTSHIIGY